MNHLDLFSGIGGFALAAREVWGDEYHTVAFCDNDYFCGQVLRKNFPRVPIYSDIRTLTNTPGDRRSGGGAATQVKEGYATQSQQPRQLEGGLEGSHIDLITGGFPCQPFSAAGRRRGTKDDRYLWPEMLRVIREFAPTWVIAENVAGLVTWSDGLVLQQVCTDLEDQGYEVQPFIIPACGVNAPHRRDRVWIIANCRQFSQRDKGDRFSCRGKLSHKEGQRTTERNGFTNQDNADYPQFKGLQIRQPENGTSLQGTERGYFPDWTRDWQEIAFATCDDGVDDGLSKRLVRLSDGTAISYPRWRKEALKAYGNSIVPQVAMEIMKGIKNYET